MLSKGNRYIVLLSIPTRGFKKVMSKERTVLIKLIEDFCINVTD